MSLNRQCELRCDGAVIHAVITVTEVIANQMIVNNTLISATTSVLWEDIRCIVNTRQSNMLLVPQRLHAEIIMCVQRD